jgi:hypothetical protein
MERQTRLFTWNASLTVNSLNAGVIDNGALYYLRLLCLLLCCLFEHMWNGEFAHPIKAFYVHIEYLKGDQSDKKLTQYTSCLPDPIVFHPINVWARCFLLVGHPL